MSSSSGPAVPPNSAASASAVPAPQQKIQRIPIQVCVNNPIGAPQFAAISSITEDTTSDENNGNNNNNNNNSANTSHLLLPHDPDQQAASLFTSFPHDRGLWNGLILDRSNPDSDGKTKKIKCYSTWAAPENYKGFFALASAGGDLSDDDDEDNEDGEGDDEDNDEDANQEEGGADGEGDDNDEDDEDNDDEDDGGDNAGGGNSKKQMKRKNNKKKPPFFRKKKNHIAFRRVPDKRHEAWFVLTEHNNQQQEESLSEGENPNTYYDMLPLTEVFSCSKREFETDKQQVRPDGRAPKLYFCESTRSGIREERKEDRREAKLEAIREEEERKRRRRGGQRRERQ